MIEFLFYCKMGAPQGPAGHLWLHRMKTLPSRMLGSTGELHTGSLKSLAAA